LILVTVSKAKSVGERCRDSIEMEFFEVRVEERNSGMFDAVVLTEIQILEFRQLVDFVVLEKFIVDKVGPEREIESFKEWKHCRELLLIFLVDGGDEGRTCTTTQSKMLQTTREVVEGSGTFRCDLGKEISCDNLNMFFVIEVVENKARREASWTSKRTVCRKDRKELDTR
jgi:hypothetical protein